MKADDLDISEELGGFGDDGLDLGPGGEFNGFRQRRDQLRALSSLLWLVIYQIPKERLQYFRWHHSTTCSKLSMNLVATRHGKSLRNLQLNNTCEGWAEGIHTCHALSTLQIADLDQFTSPDWVVRLVALNSPVGAFLKPGHRKQSQLVDSQSSR
ncbi:hypothetical protein HO173_008055 [Letharia columbiana]|uniref:Uncharacterized protein n=1 Tax=Letharia columbiana TaxID=112416 RepID=A0A8H6L358_9LECA|nr:uncharacterized protein HO173_008055 [Letharia columbiana]KAF6233843.1 hypothetical protein HO173_008055 [Letharia columbiana]